MFPNLPLPLFLPFSYINLLIDNRIIISSRRLLFRRPRVICQTVQTEADQTRFHPSRRWPRPRNFIRECVFSDDHLSFRGLAAELQKHVQIDAPAQEVASRGRLNHGDLSLHRQNCRPGTETKETNLNRGQYQRGFGATLQ